MRFKKLFIDFTDDSSSINVKNGNLARHENGLMYYTLEAIPDKVYFINNFKHIIVEKEV